ncbi:MAG TPA: hypothetical protein VFR47_10090 [Anaerolineales bacterium]|nr:hypothetical protein [Anaerolineales bacterium]
MKTKSVIVIGAGICGLTAADEGLFSQFQYERLETAGSLLT